MNKLDLEKLACVFKVFSVETRIRMLELLKDRSLCVNALARTLNITPAAVSQHLRILRSSNMLTSEKRGYFVHYSINGKEVDKLKKVMEKFLSIN